MAERIVAEFESPLEAEEALAVLLQSGISGRVQERATSGLDQYLHAAGRWYELRIRDSDVERAEPLIVAFREEVERDAPESAQAAADEAGAPAGSPEPERPTELTASAKLGGTLLQVHAALEVGVLLVAGRRHGIELILPGLAASFDFGLGTWIRQGGRNAARLATLRFGLATVLFGGGALWAMPDVAPILSVTPMIALTAATVVLLWGTRKELGVALFALYVGLLGASVLGVFDPAAPHGLACPTAPETWIGVGRYEELEGNGHFTLCGSGHATVMSASAGLQKSCWTAAGAALSFYRPGETGSTRTYQVQSAKDAQCTKEGCALVIGGVEYRLAVHNAPCL